MATLTDQRDSARAVADAAVAAADVSRDRYTADSTHFEQWREIERDVATVEARRASVLADSLVAIVDAEAAVIVREIQTAHTEERRAWENERATFEAERVQLFTRVQTLEEALASVTSERDIQADIIDRQALEAAALRAISDPPFWTKLTANLTDPRLAVGLAAGFVIATATGAG